MGFRRLEFLLLLFFFLLSSSHILQYLFASALNEEQSVRNGRIWENHSTKTRFVREIIVNRRGGGGTAAAHGGTGYSSNSAMNHGNNNDNKPAHRGSGSCTINQIGFTYLGFLLLSASFFLI